MAGSSIIKHWKPSESWLSSVFVMEERLRQSFDLLDFAAAQYKNGDQRLIE
jgi:hypothetical protein